MEQDEGQVPEAIEDGIRYVTAAPYGLEKAQTVTVFLPGTPVDRLPEGFMIWSHLQEIDPEAKSIPYYAIWNEADEAGFITAAVSEMQDKPETGAVTNEPGLPAYAYSGDDPIEGAIADYLAGNERAKEYLTEPGYVTIPCPIIHKTERRISRGHHAGKCRQPVAGDCHGRSRGRRGLRGRYRAVCGW